MKKIIFTFIFITIAFLCFIAPTYAADYIADECLSDGTCRVVCSYESTYTVDQSTFTYDVTLYKLSGNGFKINYRNADYDTINTYTIGPSSLHKLMTWEETASLLGDDLSNKVLWKASDVSNLTLDTFTSCPEGGYHFPSDKYQIVCFDKNDGSCQDSDENQRTFKYNGTFTRYTISSVKTYDIFEEEGISSLNDVTITPTLDVDYDFDGDETECASYLGNPDTEGTPAYYMQFIFNLMKYIGIILLIVLSIVEFVKALASGDQAALKKAGINTGKRLIICVVLFFLPALIKLLLQIFGIYSDCGIS